jgi:phosphodiesterase/alkaline phosphatase D-like protein
MPQTPRMPVRMVAALMFALALAMLAVATGASAAPYGEVGSTGSKGGGNGQFTMTPFETAAIGVDPTDNSVYVADVPGTKGEIRIQKFATTEKGEFKFVASAKFKPKGSTGEEAAPIEGVAVDPVMHRLYVLALNERSGGEKQIDRSDEAASELFAFSTEQSGEVLPPVGTEGGLIAGTTVLKPTANNPEESLLEPSGIAVEPIDATHDTVVLLGIIDAGPLPENKGRILHSAVWRVSSEGKLLPEKRFVDTTDVFEAEALSPVVFNGKLYVQGEEGIYEIPAAGAPKRFTESTPEREEWWEELGLFLTPAIQEPFLGAGMTVGPEGTFWTTASIKLAANKNNFAAGAVSYDQTGSVLGWTGGQSAANPAKKCFLQLSGTPLVAAGKEWKPGAGHIVFVLDDNFSFPKLMQFGPGGEGCPTAEAASPTAAVGGVTVEESQPIPIAATVELDSKITQGDALSAEWNFGDGSAPVTITKPAHQEALVNHKFASGGTHTVTVKIHSDDLASPTIEATGHVTISSEPPPAPSAATGSASSVSATAELVKGAVNPHGSETTCKFEYGLTTSYGKSVPCGTQPGSGNSEVAVQAEITGLAEKTTFHYRLVAENAEKKTGTGNDREFTTTGSGALAPKVKTEAATLVGPKGATLNAKVDPEGSEVTECKLEYGTTEAYGASVACSPSPGSGTSDVAVSGVVTGLTPNTTYHFRVRAKNSNPTAALGADATFKTTPEAEPPAPKVKTEAATGVGPKGASLNAKVNPEGSEVTECKLEYGETETYGASVACSPPPGSGSSDVAVSGAVTGLTPNTTYHFRVRAKNSNATTSFGADATLKTAEEGVPPAPTVKTETATAVGTNGATLNAKVNPEGSEVTECKLEYGQTEAYGSNVPCSPSPGSGTSAVAVSGEVIALTPNTTYHFRIRAKNGNPSTSFGADATFKTTAEGEPPAPQVKTEPPGTISSAAATLKAVVNAEGSPTECTFEYGSSESYGSTATCMPTPVGSSPTPVAANVGGLTPNTTYHYRVRAKNGSATTAFGADVTFKTRQEESKGTTGGEEPAAGAGNSPPPASTATTPAGGVQGRQEASPNATIAGSAVSVGSNGAFTLKVSCPADAGTCTGSVVVKTAGAVAASARGSLAAVVSSAVREVGDAIAAAGHAAAHKSVMTLSSGSFSVAAGQSKPVSLHLSAKSRKLLAKLHVVRAKVTIAARNPSGATHTGVASLVLRLKKKH